MTSTDTPSIASDRRPLNLARQLLAAAFSDPARRAYLREVGSDYAEAEWQVMSGAFAGRVLDALDALANAYEQEITRDA